MHRAPGLFDSALLRHGVWARLALAALMVGVPLYALFHGLSEWAFAAMIVLAVAQAALSRRMGKIAAAQRSRDAGVCPHCGYDLRASSERCPECGAESSS
jgi:hypothetical protein